MIPFMAEDLYNIPESIVKKFVRNAVVEDGPTGETSASIDLNKNENSAEQNNVEVGFAVKTITDKLDKSKNVYPLQTLDFQTEWQLFLKPLSA